MNDSMDQYIERAQELGALDARVVSPENVYTGAWVRFKCMFGCDGYASSRNCPPYTPTPGQTREMLDGYETAILIHGDKTVDIRHVVVSLEKELFLAGYYKAFGLACGPCRLCQECSFEGPCRNADKARPAMESFGIDVYATARAAGFPIEVVTSYYSEMDFYGLVLVK